MKLNGFDGFCEQKENLVKIFSEIKNACFLGICKYSYLKHTHSPILGEGSFFWGVTTHTHTHTHTLPPLNPENFCPSGVKNVDCNPFLCSFRCPPSFGGGQNSKILMYVYVLFLRSVFCPPTWKQLQKKDIFLFLRSLFWLPAKNDPSRIFSGGVIYLWPHPLPKKHFRFDLEVFKTRTRTHLPPPTIIV